MATRKKEMNAIELLMGQHREVEQLFSQIEAAGEDHDKKEKLFTVLADKLAMHARIEEVHFYPGSKGEQTEEMLQEAVEEHLAVKRVLSDLLDLEAGDEQFDAKITVLKEMVEHHVEEEEGELFPKVRKMLGADALVALAQEMTATQSELEGKDPRLEVPNEIEEAAKI